MANEEKSFIRSTIQPLDIPMYTKLRIIRFFVRKMRPHVIIVLSHVYVYICSLYITHVTTVDGVVNHPQAFVFR